MREKLAKDETIAKYINFLRDVKYKTHVTLTGAVEYHRINKTAVNALFELKIIKGNRVKWEWLADEPNRQLALQVLDTCLHMGKKKVTTPLLPDFATVTASFERLTERIGVYISQNESGLKRLKSAQPGSEIKTDNLFSEKEQYAKDRVYLAGQIASAAYRDIHSSTNTREPFDIDNPRHVKAMNDSIIFAVDDLLAKLSL